MPRGPAEAEAKAILSVAVIDLGSGGGVFARRPDALLALRPLEKENAWGAEPTVRYFSRIEPFGVRLRFLLLERDDPLALIELYGARERRSGGQPSCALSGR